MRLSDLRPRYLVRCPDGGWRKIAFLCPRCRSHEISVAYWTGRHGDYLFERLWHSEGMPPSFDDLTLTPSIDRTGMDKCGGWHGNITNGAVT